MFESTTGICLHYYKYSESSVVVKIFTEDFGLQSYIINGVRNKKSKSKLIHLQSLNLLNLEVTNNKKRKIQYIKEFRVIRNTNNLNCNMTKRLTSLYVSEILLKVLVEAEQENKLFIFVCDVINEIHKRDSLSKNFSLIFLLNLSVYLGFYPNINDCEKSLFDLESGCFTDKHVHYNIKGKNKEYFKLLLLNETVNIPYKNRISILKSLQKYYSLHHYNIENLKSIDVINSLRT